MAGLCLPTNTSLAKINKLSILGVRSFDNQRSETIEFYAPLTLIVGHNGSGKTTIIECLKFVTTGELPPGSKIGGAFIHDPKLCGEREVLAQVKLSFQNASGNRMIATRNLQLTVKKNTRSQHGLEGNLVKYREGERISVSSKVAELNTLLPNALGVSKAVLESVIFCHQEESLWPMSDPAALKKRFDDIFDAVKYTNAIDNIRKTRKDQGEKLKLLHLEEQQAKVDKDRGDKSQKQSEELYNQIDTLREQFSKMSERMSEADSKYKEAWEKSNSLGATIGTLRAKRSEQDHKLENIQKHRRRNLKELEESDEELATMLEQYQSRVDTLEESEKEQTHHYKQLQRELEQIREALTVKQRDVGKHQAEQANHERQLDNREQLIKQTARRHNIRGFDMDLSNEHVRLFMERLGKMAREQNAAFERARQETQRDLQQAQADLNRINQQKSALNQRKESTRSAIASNDRKISQCQTESDRVDIDEGAKATLESAIDDVQSRLSHAKSDFEAAHWEKTIDEADKKVQTLEAQKEKLDEEILENSKRAGDTARLDVMRKNLDDCERSLRTMSGAHGQKIKDVVGGDWTAASLESDYSSAVNTSASRLGEAERQRDGVSRELEQVNYKLSTCRSDLKRSCQELRTSEQTVRDAIDDDPAAFPARLKELEEESDTLKSDTSKFVAMKDYFTSCMQTANNEKACRLCRRRFEKNDEMLGNLLKYLNKELDRAENGISNEDTDALETDLSTAKSAQSAYNTWIRLREGEIPALGAEEARLSTRHDELTSQVEQHDGTVSEREDEKRDVDSLSKTVQTIVKYFNDAASLQSQIKELSTKQSGIKHMRSPDQIQDDQKVMNEQSRVAKAAVTKATSDRDRGRGLINKFELELRDSQSKLSDASHQLKEKMSLERQIAELKSSNVEQRSAIRSIDQDLQNLGPEDAQAKAKYDDIQRRGTEKDRQLREDRDSLNDSLRGVQSSSRDIDEYISSGGPQRLTQTTAAIEHYDAEVAQLEHDMSVTGKEVKNIQDNRRNVDETKQSITDNLDFRRDQRILQDLAKEIGELESRNAEEEYDDWVRERTRWENMRYKLSGDNASLVASIKEKDDRLTQLIDDWNTEYKDAAKKFKEAHIRVETTKAAVEDLARYAGALDKAVMKFHTLKMEEINRIIDELWRRTYQGTDVDSISIRSDNEGAKGGKTFNYRVCMVKQDAEMDMRGRCSAGQKVLASIIIRLALAECFGINCGLIALDEPTTNLDRDNIRALAESLSEIIRVRRQQSNFQLIVITHDEDFLRYMNCADFTDYYYRVSRTDNQKSKIERQTIADMV